MRYPGLLTVISLAVLMGACGADPQPPQYGPNPDLPEPKRGILPSMVIADPAPWGDKIPTVPEGYTVTAIATDLKIPRQTLVLPNGDILVAEGRGGNAPKLKPKDVIAGYIKAKGTTSVESGNRLTLLRDADGDGEYELQTVFADNLNAPYGLALIGDTLYVANQDELVKFSYREGQTQAEGPPESVTELPKEINHHWTKAMTASADGRYLYVGIGSNSNITERGMTAEADRAVIWQIDPETGAHRTYATGLRNPTALAIHPETEELWAVVNERDEIGPDLVPDYLTSVQEGGFYGWPYSYWGQNVDDRVRPQDPEKVASAIVPDYALGAHVATLGVDFSTPAMGEQFAQGAFVGEHGSWNRAEPVGYRVIFVPFTDGRPSGDPIEFVGGFRDEDGTTRGRPVGVTVDPRGALIVADDLANVVWRVAPTEAVAAPETGAASESTPSSEAQDSADGGAGGAEPGDSATGDTDASGAPAEETAVNNSAADEPASNDTAADDTAPADTEPADTEPADTDAAETEPADTDAGGSAAEEVPTQGAAGG